MGKIAYGAPATATVPPLRFVEAKGSAALTSDVDLDDNCRGVYVVSTATNPAPVNIEMEFSDGTSEIIAVPPFVQFPVFLTRILQSGTATATDFSIFAIY